MRRRTAGAVRSALTVGLLACALAAWGSAAAQGRGGASESPSAACADGLDLQRVLNAHGSGATDGVRTLDFTFHARTPDGEMVRDWHWDLVRGQVTLSFPSEEPDGPRQLLAFESPAPDDASEEIREADRWFVNDRYWLLFPLQLGWEEGVAITVACTPEPQPLGGGEAPRITVEYTGDGGYTPGDAYDFYPAPNGQITQWVFRRGAAAEPTFVVAFDEYAEVGPLTLSLMRRGADGQPRVWFTEVSVTTDSLEHAIVPDGE